MTKITRIVVLLGAIMAATSLGGCRDHSLYSGLSQREANEMLAVLQAAGIQATTAPESRGGTHALNVSAQHIGASIQVLTRAGLPRAKQGSLQEILPKDSWMATPSEERARLAFGISQELTRTLMQITGVVDARVHVALAEKNALGQTTAQPSASILVRYDADLLGGDFQDNIKGLVAGSVAGLAYDKVSVTMIPSDAGAQLTAGGARPVARSAQAGAPAWLWGLVKVGLVLAIASALAAAFLKLIRGRA